MNVLIVEDESSSSGPLQSAMKEAAEKDDWQLEIRLAENRDDALSIISDESWPIDFAVLDLQIPRDGSLTPADRSFGKEVFEKIQKLSPGTRIVVFTGNANGAIRTFVVDAGWKSDPLGTKASDSMVEYVEKDDIDECVTRVADHGVRARGLDEIELSTGVHNIDLSSMQERVIRIFARRSGATRVKISPLGDGLSSATTVRLELMNDSVRPFSCVVIKIDIIENVRWEKSMYEKHVAGRLQPGAFAHFTDLVESGAADQGGVAFILADDFDATAVELLNDEDKADALVSSAMARTSKWRDASVMKDLSVGEIRRAIMSDGRLARVRNLIDDEPWELLEDVRVNAHICTQHGDLHLLNLLANESGEVVLIDFVSATNAPASLDPVTLELGLVFNPKLAPNLGDWPSLDQLNRWNDLESLLVDCPYPAFVRACREWAHDAAAGEREVWASAYAYGMRQLQWPSGSQKAQALIGGLIRDLSG